MPTRSSSPSPHRLDPLLAIVGQLCPDLSLSARRRVAEMADMMRARTEQEGACTAADLLAAGFSATEIESCGPVAKEALDQLRATPLPEEAASPFSLADAAALRRFAALRRISHNPAFA